MALSSTRSTSLTEEMMMLIIKLIIVLRGAPAPPPPEPGRSIMNEEEHLGATWCSDVLEGAQGPRSAHLCALMLSSTRTSSLSEEMMMLITEHIIALR